ncbi:MAG: alanine racemase [Geminicoccaceae bacterium]|nr:alanine racemase [Geminicoccaceae bacterium]
MTGRAEQAPVVDEVEANLRAVRERIAAAARAVGRAPAEVTLVAVGKAQPDERVRAALAAGQRVFGENYVQEAKARWSPLGASWPDLQLHMIGPIQTNKAKDVVALFDVIETVDRPKLAEVLAREMARQDRRPACFVQVNTGEEAQKAGVWPADADRFIEAAARNGLAMLSMGMSADFEVAVQFGATHVRVGSAIFGARPPRPAPAG